MAIAVGTAPGVPRWKQPTKAQWLAWWAGGLGWTRDAFDFTIFLLIMVPIAKEFNVSLAEVTAVVIAGFAPSFRFPVRYFVSLVIALLLGPETKGKALVADLVVA
jgi:hypothetical protein